MKTLLLLIVILAAEQIEATEGMYLQSDQSATNEKGEDETENVFYSTK